MTHRQTIIARRLREVVRSGDCIAIIRTGGTAKNKQVEIIVAPKKGKPQVITSWVCTLLDCRRAGRDRDGGLRCSNYQTPQELAQDIREALGLEKLDFTTY